MPTILKLGSLLFFFTSYDCVEPMHIHIVDGRKECKFWLTDNERAELADNNGFTKSEIIKLQKIVEENYQKINNIWNEHCKNTKPKEYKKKRNK